MSGFRLKPKGESGGSPIGRCIYCDSIEEPLTKEHIIPESLRGNWTLRKASCEICREITRTLEEWIARDVFQDVRAEYKLKVKQPPTTIPMRQGPYRTDPILAHVKPEDYPRHLFLAVSEPPGLLEGRGRQDDGKFEQNLWTLGDDGPRRARRLSQGLPDEVHRVFDPWRYARFMAKIALGMAVRYYGIDGFDPTDLRKIILGKNNHPFYLVGRNPDILFDFWPPSLGQPRKALHRGKVHWFDMNMERYAYVQIQLFVQLNLPVYCIIAGKLTPAGFEKTFMQNEFRYT